MILSPLPARTFRITQGFGKRPEYYKQYGHDGHNGYDMVPRIMGLRKHMDVYAPHEGYCKVIWSDKGYGNYVQITSTPYNLEGHRRRSVLAHLREPLVENGQWVGAGDLIGVMGNTGNSSGIHLHWTYKRLNGKGVTLDRDNGYAGAIPIGKYTLQWLDKTII